MDQFRSGQAGTEGREAGTEGREAGAPDPVLESPGGGQLCDADELLDGLVIADQAGLIAVFNSAAERLTGISAEKTVGHELSVALPLVDGEGRCWWQLSRPYDGLSIRTRHPERPMFLPDGTELLVTVGYVRWPRRGGTRRGVPGHRGPGPSGAGVSPGDRAPGEAECLPMPAPLVVGSPHEPGAVRRVIVTLRSVERRERAERLRADLVSTVAHELRSPLTSVKGFTATLLAKWPRFTDDQKRVMLETVNADADHLTRLIAELLDVSRIEAGRVEVRRELVDIGALAGKIVLGRVAAGESASRFEIVVADGLPETWLDADKIAQILSNLIENAIRHGAGTVTTVIESALVRGGPGVAVCVRDQGEGVAPELAPRVFRQFWRAKRRGGAGLGLFIVKGLVEAHGGAITVAQAPGGGAEFRFTMPAGSPDHG